jgi:hypothetical protein
MHKGFKCLDVSEGHVYISLKMWSSMKMSTLSLIFIQTPVPSLDQKFYCSHPPFETLHLPLGTTILCPVMVMIPCILTVFMSIQVLLKIRCIMLQIRRQTVILSFVQAAFHFWPRQAPIPVLIRLPYLVNRPPHQPRITHVRLLRLAPRRDVWPPLRARQLSRTSLRCRRRGNT